MNSPPYPAVNMGPDELLCERARQGDREAFRQIVERYQTLICSIAFSRCGRLAWSQDLAQETFVIAWQRLGELREPARLRAWLCGIARNLASGSARRESRRGGPPASLEAVHATPSDEPDPADEAISGEEAALLWHALEQLPDAYREPMVLFYRQGESIRDVAEALELSHDAVKQRLSRGRSMLREELLAHVEFALARTRPTAAFTTAVVGTIAALAPPAAEAAIVASAAAAAPASGSSIGKAVLGALGKWILIGPLIGVLISWWSTRLAASTARSAAERACVQRFARRTVVFCWIMVIVLIAALLPVGRGYSASPLWIIGGVLLWTAGLVGWIIYSSTRADQEILRIRAATGTDDAAYGRKLAARGVRFSGAWDYVSKARLLGLPLVAISCGSVDGPAANNRRKVVGWIACGDLAISPLLALGGVAIGPVAVGACTVGFLSFSLWGVAVGALAFGSVAAGWWAYGFAALGWRSAVGAAALARDYAIGPMARAAEANTPAAQAWLATQWSTGAANAFLHSAHWIILLILLVAWARMWLQRRQRQRLGG